MTITFECGNEKATYYDLDLASMELARHTIRLNLVRMTGRSFAGMSSMSFELKSKSGKSYLINASGANSVSLVCDLLDAR